MLRQAARCNIGQRYGDRRCDERWCGDRGAMRGGVMRGGVMRSGVSYRSLASRCDGKGGRRVVIFVVLGEVLLTLNRSTLIIVLVRYSIQ